MIFHQSTRHRTAHTLLTLGCVIPLLILAGCGTFGSNSVTTTHKPYNESIALTEDQQLLLNLVRLRYRDNPFFMEITQIASTQSWSGSAGFSAEIVNQNPQDTYSPGFGTAYSNSPTVSYSPLQGEQFIQKLLAPIPLLALLSLTGSGWSAERVMRISAERLNHVRNAPGASGPTPSYAQEYKKFNELSHLFRALQKKRQIELKVEPGNDLSKLILVIKHDASTATQARRIKEILGVDTSRQVFKFRQNFLEMAPDQITVRTRSMLGALFYLCNGVEVPLKDIAANRVVVTRNSDGSSFDWDDVLGGFFKVHSSEGLTKPDDAFISVRYRDAWFYIRDNDLNSKSTFMLLNQLFNLQSGDIKSVTPTLTISVN